jgi:hypothetical protein
MPPFAGLGGAELRSWFDYGSVVVTGVIATIVTSVLIVVTGGIRSRARFFAVVDCADAPKSAQIISGLPPRVWAADSEQ